MRVDKRTRAIGMDVRGLVKRNKIHVMGEMGLRMCWRCNFIDGFLHN